MTSDRRVLVHRDRSALTAAVAARFITKLIDLLDEQEFAHVVLTGGGVGTGILSSINDSDARDSVDWTRVHFWWGDERWVDAGSVDRNDAGARAALLDHISVPTANIHSFPASDDGIDLDTAAALQSAELQRWAADGASVPAFDVTFLGVGPDGHIASLFPDTPGIGASVAAVIAVRDSPKPPPERLSLTLPAINSSKRIWLCVAGADKASALGLALAGANPVHVPAAGARGIRRTVFFIDAEAAEHVPTELISSDY